MSLYIKSTVRRSLLKSGLKGCVAVRIPLLRKGNKTKRLKYAQEHRNWTMEQWSKVLWTVDGWTTTPVPSASSVVNSTLVFFLFLKDIIFKYCSSLLDSFLGLPVLGLSITDDVSLYLLIMLWIPTPCDANYLPQCFSFLMQVKVVIIVENTSGGFE